MKNKYILLLLVTLLLLTSCDKGGTAGETQNTTVPESRLTEVTADDTAKTPTADTTVQTVNTTVPAPETTSTPVVVTPLDVFD